MTFFTPPLKNQTTSNSIHHSSASDSTNFCCCTSLHERTNKAEVWIAKVYLEVNNNAKHKDGGNEVGEIWQVLTIEGFTQTTHFICSGCQQMEEGNDSSFKLSSWKTV